MERDNINPNVLNNAVLQWKTNKKRENQDGIFTNL